MCILRLIFQGKANKEIAAAMGFTHGTVRVYVSQILQRMGATSRTAAVFKALQLGLLQRTEPDSSSDHGNTPAI